MADDLARIDYGERELLYNRFMEPALRSAVGMLAPQPGSWGLDVGCGPGGVLPLLNEAALGSAYIVGLDISKGHLVRASQQIATTATSNHVSLLQVDLRDPLPFPDHSFDWAWTADTLSSGADDRAFPDPAAVIRELVRVVKPGGKLAAFFGNWLGAMFLPGHAHIEQCLVTGLEVRYRKREHFHPSFRHENALAWFLAAGLSDIRVSPHVVLYQYPLSRNVVEYIQHHVFEAEYNDPPDLKAYALGAGLTEDDWEAWLSLSNPASPDYLLNRPDYFCVRYAILTTGVV